MTTPVSTTGDDTEAPRIASHRLTGPLSTRTVSFKISPRVLAEVDMWVTRRYDSRSQFIHDAIEAHLRRLSLRDTDS